MDGGKLCFEIVQGRERLTDWWLMHAKSMWLATHGTARASATPFGDTVFVEPTEPINRCLGHWRLIHVPTLGHGIVRQPTEM
jgi:hypothetical protein